MLRMSMLESTRPQGEAVQSVADYRATELSTDMNQIHHTDLMKSYLQIRNMIHINLDLQHYTKEKLHTYSIMNNLVPITANYRLEKTVTQARNVKIKMLEKALLELSEDPRNIKHSQKLLKDKAKELNLLKQKLKIPGPYPGAIQEIEAVEREKEDIARQFFAAKDKIHSYISQVEYLQGRLSRATAENIPSAMEQLSEAKTQTSDRKEIICLQVQLTEKELALTTLGREKQRLEGTIQEQAGYIATLEQNAAQHRDSAQGVNTLKTARKAVWVNIYDVVAKEWYQLLKYQELKEQVTSAYHKLQQLDQEIGDKDEIAKAMLTALENLTEEDLTALGITSRIGQMRSASKVIRKKVLMEETRTMDSELGIQCREYRERFIRCQDCGLPSIFDATGDIYAKDVYMYKLEAVGKEEAFLNAITGEVGPKDINLALKNCYEVLTGLKYVFADPNRPNYQKGAELSFAVSGAEEYKYPLGKDWNLLMNCITVYKQKNKKSTIVTQSGEHGRQEKVVARKTVMIQQQQIWPANPTMRHAPPPQQHRGSPVISAVFQAPPPQQQQAPQPMMSPPHPCKKSSSKKHKH